jgi:predicted enzyme related to lactoylglutathione lyase
MSDFESCFVWYELMTSDLAAATVFYRDVVGWGAQPGPAVGMDYTIVTASETWIAGMMKIPDEAKAMGQPPRWTGYVGVANVDNASAHAKKLGGTIHMGPMDIPNIGRFAVMADPQGAVLCLFQAPDGVEGPKREPYAPGNVGWHSLATTDWTKAFEFYHALFGWTKKQALDIGAMGTYQIVASPGTDIGGMFNKPATTPVAAWLYYFSVGDIDAAAARVTAGGGSIVNGPMEVGQGMWVVQCRDPQGAAFALLGKRG